MKTVLLLLLSAGSVLAQTNERVFALFSIAPAPTNLPSLAYYVYDYSNATPVSPTGSWVSFQSDAWTDYLRTNNGSWQSWHTNPANILYQQRTNFEYRMASNSVYSVTQYFGQTFTGLGGRTTNLSFLINIGGLTKTLTFSNGLLILVQ